MAQSFAIAFDQNIVGDNPTEIYFNTPEAVAAAEFLRQQCHTGRCGFRARLRQLAQVCGALHPQLYTPI